MRAAIIAILLGCLAMPSAFGQASEAEVMIAHAQRADVSKLDRNLPSQRFADWLAEIVGPGAIIKWEVNDCGERTGSEADLQRDLPFCVEADATLPDGRKVVLVMAAGTEKKGLSKRPGGFYYSAVEQGEEAHTFRNLSELPTILKRGLK
jgi:hypothetical protein